MIPITVFSAPGCGQCVATKAHLKKRRLLFEEIRVDEAWVDRLKIIELEKGRNLAGLPVVLVGDEDVWSGYSSDSIDEWARELVAAA